MAQYNADTSQLLKRKMLRGGMLALMLITSCWFFLGFGRKATVFYGDDMGYYVYLPSAVIYHNLDSINKVPEKYSLPSNVTWYYSEMAIPGQITPTGHVLIQYTYGVALLELPFFAAAHLWEHLANGDASGYSPAYANMVKLSSIVYALLGLLIVYRILRRYFSSTLSLGGITALYLGSNLFWFTLHQSGMAHVPLFFLYALLMLLTIRVYEQPAFMRFLAIALVAGLITLIRPTDVICLVIPLLYGITRRADITERLQFLKAHRMKLAAMIPVFLLPIIPQMIYWKAMSGHYLYYSYGSQQFYWKHPKIFAGIFEFQNGWLAYSPLMAFSLLGFFCYRAYRKWNWCIWLLLPLYIYIVYSWYCFNYINGLGSRPMIHMYPLLALPLTAFLQYMAARKLAAKALVMTAGVFFIALNISWSMQQSLGILLSEESNAAYNYVILFRTKLRYNDLVVRDCHVLQPDTARLEKVRMLGRLDFDAPAPGHVPDGVTGKGNVLYMTDNQYLDERICVVYNKAAFGTAQWLKGSGRFMTFHYPGYYKHELVMVFKRGDDTMRRKTCMINNKMDIPAPGTDTGENSLKLQRCVDHKWSIVYYFVDIPRNLRDGDSVLLTIRNAGKEELLADDVTLDLYKKK